MKSFSIDEQKLVCFILTKQEATNLITLLVGQLADCAVINNHTGSAPTMTDIDNCKRYVFCIENEKCKT